jgi:hypothetical protein
LWSGKGNWNDFKRRVSAQVAVQKRRGVKSGPFGIDRSQKAIPWEPAWWKKSLPEKYKEKKPWSW